MGQRDIRYPQMFRMHTCVSLARKMLDKILEENLKTGLSQSMILIYIGSHPGSSQKDISEDHDITPAAVSRHIETLLQKGYILRKDNAANRRENLLQISPEGLPAMHKALEIINTKLDTLFTDISENELHVLEKIFQKFISSIEKE